MSVIDSVSRIRTYRAANYKVQRMQDNSGREAVCDLLDDVKG